MEEETTLGYMTAHNNKPESPVSFTPQFNEALMLESVEASYDLSHVCADHRSVQKKEAYGLMTFTCAV